MDIIQLKDRISNNTLDDSPLIFKYADVDFLPLQYAAEIAKVRNLKIIYIDDPAETNSINDFFDETPANLFIYNVEKLAKNILPDYKNLIVICKTITIDVSIDFIEFPKLINWQIEDFVKARVSGLTKQQIKWLCEITKYNIYRIDQECKKLEIFSKNEQKIIFDQLNVENNYCDLNTLTIFNLTNSLIKHDLKTVANILKDLRWIDIEGVGLITILHSQLQHLIDIQLNPHASAEALGMTQKQFMAIRYNCNVYSDMQLISMFEFITSLDMRLKAGEFQFSSNSKENNLKFIEYIIYNILTIGK